MSLYRLFANCILSNGHSRAIIFDLQKSNYHLIPHSLYYLVDEKSDTIKINVHEYPEHERKIIEEYCSFLLNNELAFLIDDSEKDLFPKLNTECHFSSIVTNVIVDIDKHEPIWDCIINQLELLRCNYVQIRFYSLPSYGSLEEIGKAIFSSLLQGFEILLPFYEEMHIQEISEFVNQNPKLRSLIFFNASENKEIHSTNNGFSDIYFIMSNITSSTHCGIIHPSYFSVNIPTYTESLAHNTCLNRKIAIDTEGNIKNCPSMKESYGNIKDTTLAEAIEKPGFKKYWNLTKDQISKCKDCEFRHICTDCRAYLENPEDIYSAPLKCGYDPYTCEWEDWSTNPLKHKAIEYYGMKEL